MIIANRRIGKFVIPIADINLRPKLARNILNRVIVLQADVNVANEMIEYTAICDRFRKVSPVEHTPYYHIEVANIYDPFSDEEVIIDYAIKFMEV